MNDKNKMTLKEWIFRKHNEDKNFTQQSFAAKIGMNYCQLNRILNGHNVPCVETALAMQQATGGEIDGWTIQLQAYYMQQRHKQKQKVKR